MSTVLVMQHHPVENLGTIEQALTAAGLKAEYVHSYAGTAGASATWRATRAWCSWAGPWACTRATATRGWRTRCAWPSGP